MSVLFLTNDPNRACSELEATLKHAVSRSVHFGGLALEHLRILAVHVERKGKRAIRVV